MDEFLFNCPHCQQLVMTPAALAGKSADCPRCRGVFTVPKEAGGIATVPVVPAPPAPQVGAQILTVAITDPAALPAGDPRPPPKDHSVLVGTLGCIWGGLIMLGAMWGAFDRYGFFYLDRDWRTLQDLACVFLVGLGFTLASYRMATKNAKREAAGEKAPPPGSERAP